jgi:hypothetical protein
MQWMEDSASHLQNLDISRLRGEALLTLTQAT